MDEIFTRVWQDFVARTTGPLWFRLILQPLVATVFGVRAGLKIRQMEAKEGAHDRLLDPVHLKDLFRQALRDVGVMFLVGFILDGVFQVIGLKAFYPGEALVAAFLLVALPYQIVRSLVAWLGKRG